LFLCLTNYHYVMRTYGTVDVYIHVFWSSALVGGEWSASRPSCFTAGEIDHGTHWIGGWVGPRTSMYDVEKRKLLTLPGLKLWSLCRPAVASRYTDCAITTPRLVTFHRRVLIC
jgi:hypothetical protein